MYPHPHFTANIKIGKYTPDTQFPTHIVLLFGSTFVFYFIFICLQNVGSHPQVSRKYPCRKITRASAKFACNLVNERCKSSLLDIHQVIKLQVTLGLINCVCQHLSGQFMSMFSISIHNQTHNCWTVKKCAWIHNEISC